MFLHGAKQILTFLLVRPCSLENGKNRSFHVLIVATIPCRSTPRRIPTCWYCDLLLFYSQYVFDSNARSHWLNRGHEVEFKSNFETCCPTGEALLSRVTFESGKGKIRRENWWLRVLKVRFCNFDNCFHSKTKMEPQKKRFIHLTDQR